MKVRVCEEEGFYACPVCGQSVPLDWTVEEHLETLKPLLGLNAECGICNKKFIEHRALKQHMNYCKRKKQDRDAQLAAEQRKIRIDRLRIALPIVLSGGAALLLYRQFVWRRR
jgi:hypothetical protein